MTKSQLLESFFDTSAKIKRLLFQASNDQGTDRIATFFQLQVLSYISEHSGTTPGQISESFCMSSSSTAQLTDRIITSGWVDRDHDKDDRRVVRLKLTATGKVELERLKEIRRKRLEPLLKHLSETDMTDLVRILDKVYISMEKELKGEQK